MDGCGRVDRYVAKCLLGAKGGVEEFGQRVSVEGSAPVTQIL